jgi:hypothetical protein
MEELCPLKPWHTAKLIQHATTQQTTACNFQSVTENLSQLLGDNACNLSTCTKLHYKFMSTDINPFQSNIQRTSTQFIH